MSEEPQIRSRVESFGGGTVDDLVDWVLRRDLTPSKVQITSCHLKFETPESPIEVERRLGYEEANRQRTESWERMMLTRLTEKYGQVSDDC